MVNTHSKHKHILYTRLARGRDGREIRSQEDIVLTKSDMLKYVHDAETECPRLFCHTV